ELDAVLAATHADELGAGRPVGPVAVGVGRLEVRVAVEAVGVGRRRVAPPLHRDRPGFIHAQGPLGDVVVVGAPVGHLAAGILIPPAEIVVATLPAVFGLRRRAEPEVPVEPFGRPLGRERAADRVVADARLDAADRADAAIADQFAGQAEAGVGAL